MTEQELFSATRRAATLVMTLRHISRLSTPALEQSGVFAELDALEIELAALTHEIQMREVRRWLDLPIRGRLTKTTLLSTDVDHGVPVERIDSYDGTFTTTPMPNARRLTPALSGRWRNKGRRAS